MSACQRGEECFIFDRLQIMQERTTAPVSRLHPLLPWLVGAVGFVVYLATLSHWVTMTSLPYVAQVASWGPSMALQEPLFYTLTFPIRWFPASLQPLALNFFSAVCAGLSLVLLARSVILLPHDRTLAQRHKERSEFSLLTIPLAWIPPLFAALVCGLQLTFWEHATAVTSETLNLLIFAYVIRCLLEYRIDQRDSWLAKLAFVYGLGVTNNWAMIGFFPGFVVALVWIKGRAFFSPRFLLRTTLLGAAGLLLYLVLPAVWSASDAHVMSFGQALRSELGTQKGMLLAPALRNRVFLLSLVSILPLVIIGIRWPSSFGDTSAAGALLTNVMFRLVHLLFFAACISVAFDLRFSPRSLGRGLPFLTFYYLGALSLGYFTGFALLVFGDSHVRNWQRASGLSRLLNRVVLALVAAAAVAAPIGLAYLNFPKIRAMNGSVLKEFARLESDALPPSGAVVLSDDPYALLLVDGQLRSEGRANAHLLVHTRSLSFPAYHRQLRQIYQQRWPDVAADVPDGEILEDKQIARLILDLGATHPLYYLHPSFGFYFEAFYAKPQGLACELVKYPSDQGLAPLLNEASIKSNQEFWTKSSAYLDLLASQAKAESAAAAYLSEFLSRSANFWGVEAQRSGDLAAAGDGFERALKLSTNNASAKINLEFNRQLRGATGSPRELAGSDRYGGFRDLQEMLLRGGPLDRPDYCLEQGQAFLQGQLLRQAAIQFHRTQQLQPTNTAATLGLAATYLGARLAQPALTELDKLRNEPTLTSGAEIEIALLEATAYQAMANPTKAEDTLLALRRKFPNLPAAGQGLVVFYDQERRYSEAIGAADQILKIAPENGQALFNKATVYLHSNQPDDALKTIDHILEKNPRDFQALLYKIFLLVNSQRWAEAKTTAQRALEIDPSSVSARVSEASVLIELKEYAKALELLDALLDDRPNSIDALHNRALCNLQLNHLEDAWRDYKRLQAMVPRYHVAYFGLHEVAHRQKKTAEAILYGKLFLRHAPEENSPELQKERATVEERLKALGAGTN